MVEAFTYTNEASTATVPSFGEMAATVREFQARQRQIDDGLADSLWSVCEQSVRAFRKLCHMSWLEPEELAKYMQGERPIPACIWDRLKEMADRKARVR